MSDTEEKPMAGEGCTDGGGKHDAPACPFDAIAVAGLGLIGASFAGACKAALAGVCIW